MLAKNPFLKAWLALLLIAYTCPLVVYAQPDEVEKSILALMSEQPVIGLSVAVVRKNKVVYSRSFGSKDVENNIPLTDRDVFRIASISKSFSATAIMRLVDEGRLSLEDDVSPLIGFRVRNPAFPEKTITLRMLLSHRSSINDGQGYFTLDAIDPSKNPDWAKCYNAFEPGTEYRYCNLNYNIVGTILERTTGVRFDRYINRTVLQPLRLYGGYLVDSLDAGRFARIYQYQSDSGRFLHSPAAYDPRRIEIASYVAGRSTPIFSPTGGMKISAKDLAEYMVMHIRQGRHRGRRIISAKSASEMQKPYRGEEGYGLAIATTRELIPGRVMKGHTGSAYGLQSLMYFDPSDGSGIVVISNGCDPANTGGFNTVMLKAANILYKHLVDAR